MTLDQADALMPRLWNLFDDDELRPGEVNVTGSAGLLPAAFDVTGFATAAVGVATMALARLVHAHGEALPGVTVDRRAASAAFRCEALFEPIGWTRAAAWDPIAGDYECSNGWIRLHTNYAHHRAAVEQVLGPALTRDEVSTAVAEWDAEDLEASVVQAGGCAAMMRQQSQWQASPAANSSPPLQVTERLDAVRDPSPHGFDPQRPLAGIRVLDLTRVIAGPIATRFLAAYGADVLRIDPPMFDEVPALVPVTSAGKRCAALDLTQSADRQRFEALLHQADVLVCGLRHGALDGLGYSAAAIRDINPWLIDARLNAYGWSGPWQGRRGFDSLVQMSCGIAAAGAQATAAGRADAAPARQLAPRPLPAQALDHGTGYLLAAAIIAALRRRFTVGRSCSLVTSLVGTATNLMDCPTPWAIGTPQPTWSSNDTELVQTSWGSARSVPVPGQLSGARAYLTQDAGPLGRHEPTWLPR